MNEFVEKVNELLGSYGEVAIQKRETDRWILYEYVPVYLFRAVREAGGIIRQVRIIEYALYPEDTSWSAYWFAWAIVEVVLSWGEGEVPLQQVGDYYSTISKGDALRGAVTNAIVMALSLIGIGEKAYMELPRPIEKQPQNDPIPEPEPLAIATPMQTEKQPQNSPTTDHKLFVMMTPKQIRYITALYHTIYSHPELAEKYAQELKEFRKQLVRGMTKKEASDFITWCKEHGIEPTWIISTSEGNNSITSWEHETQSHSMAYFLTDCSYSTEEWDCSKKEV